MPPSPQPPKKEPVGPIVGIIIILLLMLAGAIYVWRARQTPPSTPPYIPGDVSSTSVPAR